MSEWQDISTAPKDGTCVLLFSDNNWGGTEVAWFYHHCGWTAPNDEPIHGDPTHWMPLPQPPSKPSLLADGTVDCPYNGQGVAPYKKQEGAE